MSDANGRVVGLNPLSYPHHNDHVGVLCALLGYPLLVTDEEFAKSTTHYYPNLDLVVLPWEDCTPEYLETEYDVLLHSDIWGKEQQKSRFGPIEEESGKHVWSVHVPHGYSDKGFWFEKVVEEEVVLVYGQNMLDLLSHRGVLDQLGSHILTGNYRLTYFQAHRSYYRDLVQQRVLSHLVPDQPLYLYAPTWKDEEDSSSFFEAGPQLLESLPDSINLLIKVHPQLLEDQLVELYALMGRFEEKPNVHFLEDFPPVLPLLDAADVYLGDASAIGYDALAFEIPMFFLNHRKLDPMKDRRAYLNRCGVQLTPEDFPRAFEVIEENLAGDASNFAQIRREVKDYTFDPDVSVEDLKREIEQLSNG